MKKYIILTLFSTLIISCQGNVPKKENVKSVPSYPYTFDETSYENPKETILRNFKNKPYNPNGYQLRVETIDWETGKQSWVLDKPVFIIPEPFHDLIQEYEINSFWVSDYGKSIVNQMVECYKSEVDTCRIRITR